MPKRRIDAVSRLASVCTGCCWALSLYFIRTPPCGKASGGDLPCPIFRRTSAAPLHVCPLGAVSVAKAVLTCIRRALCPCFHARASVRDPARQGASGERHQKHGLGDFRLRGLCWTDFYRGLAAYSIVRRATRKVASADCIFCAARGPQGFRISAAGLQEGLGRPPSQDGLFRSCSAAAPDPAQQQARSPQEHGLSGARKP